jgi:hypothetical protein
MPESDSHLVRPVRCAIYTRKSSEEGLDKEFNSLDATNCEPFMPWAVQCMGRTTSWLHPFWSSQLPRSVSQPERAVCSGR